MIDLTVSRRGRVEVSVRQTTKTPALSGVEDLVEVLSVADSPVLETVSEDGEPVVNSGPELPLQLIRERKS